MIQAFFYDSSGHDRKISLKKSLPKISAQQLLWIDVRGRNIDEIAEVSKLLKLSDRCAADLKSATPVYRLNTYGGYLHFDIASLDEQEISDEEFPDAPSASRLDFVVGKSWLLTIHDGDLDFLSAFRDQDRGETLIGKLTPAALTSSLLDWHLSPFLAASEGIEEVCDKLDDRILDETDVRRDFLPSIVHGVHFISGLRRLLVPQRSVFYGLSRADVALITGNSADEQFKNVEHRFERALDIVEHGRDVVRGSFELYSARLGEKTNVLIRRLTFLSIALGVVGAVAGVFGMNFETPYTKSGTFGFWLVLIGLACFIVAFASVSIRRKWI